jgi:hypothetical protein
MPARLAFTARLWGDSAVVCRAVEDRPGTVVHQEFGEFDTWTQAAAFAAKLNEGLEVAPTDALQITYGSLLACADLVSAGPSVNSMEKRPPGRVAANDAQFRFLLSELELARTFCRCAQVLPSSEFNARIIRNARNALFNVMHFVLRLDFCDRELDLISTALESLKAALQDVAQRNENSSVAHDSFGEAVFERGTFLDL